MQVGVYFPQYEIPPQPEAIRDYAQGVEAMGFRHLIIMDHVVGANKANRPKWTGTYHLDTVFHEPLTLIAYLSGITSKLGFITGVMVLPQRQTVLVAKQAACVDVLCNGRFRLGIGTGWNQVEYEALGVPFAERGKIFDEQIDVMRALWTQRAVTLEMPHHTISDAGINPLPVQRPIPLWFGGGNKAPANLERNAVDKVLRRIARVGDGWMPPFTPGDEAVEAIEKFRALCREYGREPDNVGVEGIVRVTRATQHNWVDYSTFWQKLRTTHLAFNTLHDGLQGVDAHLRRLEEVKAILPPHLFRH